jgi:large subunit ribosomal protein L23
MAEANQAGQAEPKAAEGGVSLAPYQIILRPLVSEKGVHRSSRYNQYAFEVSTLADKDAIKKAVEEMFEVKVLKVRTQNRKGKPRRHRWKLGYTRDWKKALVTLDSEDRIDFF